MKSDLLSPTKITKGDVKSLFLAPNPAVETSEQSKLLAGFNNTHLSFPAGKTIIDLFEEQVVKTPENIAVVFEDQYTTYEELNYRSNRLGHYLKSKGVTKDTFVPICIERGTDMLVGILGILKAGGAYVPMDPEYPMERIQYMLEDTCATIAVSSKSCRSKLLSQKNITIIDVKDPLITSQPANNLETPVQTDQLAYVIYTSGSTGKPKGVMVEHGNAYSFIFWSQQEFLESKFEVVYACTSICFDLSVFEMFYPLSIGKPIRIIRNGMFISKYITDDSSVLINTVPSVIDSLIRNGVDLSNISVINMAGEPLPWFIKQNLNTDKIEVRNLYGPSETTTYSTNYRIHKSEPILIGRPIANTSIYILGTDDQLVSIGTPGEICIGGAGVARGYLNKEKLTSQRFITNNFDEKQGGKIYKTGDIGRWLPDGNLEYLGRLDDQVKIRGYRIELGEIETVLAQSKLFDSAVVLAKEDKEGNKRLVSYVVPANTFDKEAAVFYLKTKLPEYMVPTLWVEMKNLPLTPNGKIDKKALPEPDLNELLKSHYVAPRNETEQKIAKAWQQTLALERIGISDNFFDLGGDSIVAIRAIAMMSKELKQDIVINDLLFHPTIDDLSNHIIRRRLETAMQENREVDGMSDTLLASKEEKTTSLIAIQKGGDETPFFAIPGFFQFRQIAAYMGRNRPFYGFEPCKYKRTEEVAAYFIKEMKTIQPKGPYLLGGFCDMGKIAFEMAHILMAEGESVPLIVLMESYAPETVMSRMSPQFLVKKSKAVLSSFREKSVVEKANAVPRGIQKVYHYIFEKEKFLNDGNVIDNDRLYVDDSIPYTIKNFPGKVALFKATRPLLNYSDDPLMGWEKYVTGPIEMHVIEGDHQNIFRDPGARKFGEELKRVLANV